MNICEILINSLVYGGEGMGRLADGRAVFVPYVLPGERVRARLVEEKRGFARAALEEVLQASPRRITPRCPHFGTCGGCHFQHLEYSDQVQAKTEILKEQLERIAGLANPPLRPLVAAPSPWQYRNTIQFHLTPAGQLGFQRAGSHEVIPISECHLMEGALNDLWPQLDFEADSGIQRVELRLGADDNLLIALESDDPQPPEFSMDLPVSAVHLSPAGPLLLGGDDFTIFEVLGRPFRVSAESFFQVNTRQAEALVRHLLEILPVPPGGTLVDVFCGVGLFSAFLAPRAGRLIGIELSPAACQDFAANLDEFDHVELYEGAAEIVLPALQAKIDTMVVDPPRAGLEPRALDAIVRLAPPALAYISCDPATLARDARRLLAAGYHLDHITPFDLFPQTYAVESISLFTRSG